MKRATKAFLLTFLIASLSNAQGLTQDESASPSAPASDISQPAPVAPPGAAVSDETSVGAPESDFTAPAGSESATTASPGDEASVEEGDDAASVRDPAQARRNQRNRRDNRRARPAAPRSAPAPSRSTTPPTGQPTANAANIDPAPSNISGLTVGQIAVRGNKKIETDAVTSRLVSKPGDAYTAEKIRQDVAALFSTGYFYDVIVDRAVTGGTASLTYTVVEKPSVVEISYKGNDEIDTDDLTEATGMKAFEILNMSKVREATEKIQKQYEDKGYFLARVTPKIEPISEDSVRLTFEIQENEKVKVKRITFLGNKNLVAGKLKGIMQTKEGGFFSFISGSGAYKQDAFDRDVKLIEYLYFNEGYVQVKVDRPQVYVTPDKKGIYITIRVEEGDRFKVGTVDFAGDLLFDRDDLFNSIEIDDSGWYVHETLLKDLRTLQAKYGDLGYAYANPIPRTRTRDKEKLIDITFEIDKGNKVYFGKINMIGNSRTRDKVIRRELQVREGELYNETRKRESMDNVRRLGYFEDVQFNPKTPVDNPDVMDMDIVVKERNTGTIQVGAGYSTYSKFIFNGQVNQINLFGRGQKLGVSVDLSSNQSLFNLNFTEPYLYDTEWSFGVDAYRSNRITQEYTEIKKGGALRIGHPLAPYLRGYLRYKFDETSIELDPTYGDPDLYPVETANGYTSSAQFSLEYDKRNDRFAPTDGVYSNLSIEYAGLGGDKRYTKGFFTGRFYKKIVSELVFRNNLTYGFIRSNDPNVDPPYNELFLLGGANSLRGYEWYTIGRRKLSQRRLACLSATTQQPNCPEGQFGLSPEEANRKAQLPFGGTQEFFYNLELEFPLISEAGIKGVVFYDIGNADDVLTIKGLRQDVGFGFRWFSPIGPLRFEWGFPLDRRTEFDEDASSFQFAIGSPF